MTSTVNKLAAPSSNRELAKAFEEATMETESILDGQGSVKKEQANVQHACNRLEECTLGQRKGEDDVEEGKGKHDRGEETCHSSKRTSKMSTLSW